MIIGRPIAILRAICAILAFSSAGAVASATDYSAPERPPSLQPFVGDVKEDEIALAQSAAPSSIGMHATIMVLAKDGYVKAQKGENGFVCLSARSWISDVTNDEFWNTRIREPACFNPAAVRTVLPAYLERTRWVLAGASLRQIDTRTRAEVAKGKIRSPESGALVYMMSKQGYLGDFLSKHPHPHLMFYFSKRGAEALGANQPGVPVTSVDGVEQPFRIFFVMVPKWSDGTPAPSMAKMTAPNDPR